MENLESYILVTSENQATGQDQHNSNLGPVFGLITVAVIVGMSATIAYSGLREAYKGLREAYNRIRSRREEQDEDYNHSI